MNLALLLSVYLAGTETTVADVMASATAMVIAQGAASADLQLRLPVIGQRKYVELIESNEALSGDAYHMGCTSGSVVKLVTPRVTKSKTPQISQKVFWIVVGITAKGVATAAFMLGEADNQEIEQSLLHSAMTSKYLPCQYGTSDSFSGPLVVAYEFDRTGKLRPLRKMVALGIQRDLEMVIDDTGKTVSKQTRSLY